jgi:hypothetical protein
MVRFGIEWGVVDAGGRTTKLANGDASGKCGLDEFKKFSKCLLTRSEQVRPFVDVHPKPL